MGSTSKGGGNYISVHSLDSVGGKWKFATELLNNRQVIKTDFTGHIKKKNLVIKPQTDFSGAVLDDLFDDYLIESAAASTELYEDGSPRSENAGNYQKLVGVIAVGGKDSAGKRKITCIVAEVDGGDYSTEADKNVETTLSFKSVRADLATDVPNTLIPSTLFGGSLPTLTIVKDTFGLVTNLTHA